MMTEFWLQIKDECDSESLSYELKMLAREFFPAWQIAKEPCDFNLIYESGVWFLYEGQEAKEPAGMQNLTQQDQFECFGGNPFKNRLKKALYQLLAAYTHRELPWGILTGVRPAKLVYTALESGLEPERILDILTRDFCLAPSKAQLSLTVAGKERDLLADHSGDDVDIYIGIPFCPTKCAYCSFVSYDFHAMGELKARYVQALIKEIREVAPLLQCRRLQSFYMGGGTPTALSPEEMRQVLTAVDETIGLARFREITVEAGRPDTFTRDMLSVLRSFGITRISVNPQTMNDKTLERIGRRHNTAQTVEAFQLAREMGFDNINMDFIMGLPGEDLDDVQYSMNEVLKLSPDSLTVHTLAIKRSSRLNLEEGYNAEQSAKEAGEMVQCGADTAAQLGMIPYYMYRQKNMAGNFENVGYALPGKECLYNIEILEERQNIIAFGAAGISKIFYPAENRLERVNNVKNVTEYIQRIDEMIGKKKAVLSTQKDEKEMR